MLTRRQFFHSALSATAATLLITHTRAQEAELTAAPYRAALPLVVIATPEPTPSPTPLPMPDPTPVPTPIPGDAAILGPASGTTEQAIAWIAARADESYSDDAIREIVVAYASIGSNVGIDWFTAIAQMCHETGHLTSFWSLRPQRNPAGIGVTGVWQNEQPANIDGWAYNTQRNRWERGLSFASWAGEAIPAHLGRLLAYALTDQQANPGQYNLIQYALSFRGITNTNRGVATTWVGLNGRWAVPGTTYGQTILALAAKIRIG
jgi:Mannosyl-glycoprotein endo-beta-N-acetylglucosaminidase